MRHLRNGELHCSLEVRPDAQAGAAGSRAVARGLQRHSFAQFNADRRGAGYFQTAAGRLAMALRSVHVAKIEHSSIDRDRKPEHGARCEIGMINVAAVAIGEQAGKRRDAGRNCRYATQKRMNRDGNRLVADRIDNVRRPVADFP